MQRHEIERLDGPSGVARRFTLVGLAVGLILILACACGAFGAEPQFQVENRVPPAFTVVNKVAPPSAPVPNADPYHFDYSKFHAYVMAGHRGVLLVGVPDTLKGSYTLHSTVASGFGGLADGTYDCYLQNGSPVMVQRVEVAAQRPFSRTPAVSVSTSTPIINATTVVPSSTTYRAGIGTGRIRTLAPGAIIRGAIENCGPLG